MEERGRLLQVAEPDLGAVAIRPLALSALDPAEYLGSGRRQAGELRAAMARIRLVGYEAVTLEQIGDALDALPGKAQTSRDLGDRLRLVLERLEHEPARERLSFGLRERLARLREELREADDLDEDVGDRGAGWCPPPRFDSILSC